MNVKQIGPYRIKRLLGWGRAGSVHLARDPDSRKPIAIRLLDTTLDSDSKRLQQFKRRMELLKRLQHPHLVRILDDGRHGSQPYYVMEYVGGPSVDDILDEHGAMSWGRVVGFGLQLCRGLKHAHDQGIVHRDLAPANLLTDGRGNLKIADFGVTGARPGTPDRRTHDDITTGGPWFMSPEQIAGEPVTGASDVYSLGAALFLMLTDQQPFEAKSLSELKQMIVNDPVTPPIASNTDMPQTLSALVECCLAKQPADRPPGVGHVLLALKKLKKEFDRIPLAEMKDDVLNNDADEFDEPEWDDDEPVADSAAPTVAENEPPIELSASYPGFSLYRYGDVSDEPVGGARESSAGPLTTAFAIFWYARRPVWIVLSILIAWIVIGSPSEVDGMRLPQQMLMCLTCWAVQWGVLLFWERIRE